MIKSAFHVVTLGALLLTFGLAPTVSAQTINVTFRVNTSTNLDTLDTDGFVQIRGALGGAVRTAPAELPGGNTIDWSAASDLILTNDGGDYWSLTFQMNSGDTISYKIWTGFDSETGTSPGDGWEAGIINPHGVANDNNRMFIAGDVDTTVQLQYYNTGSTKDQFFRPFEAKPDSIAIQFRVNMAGLIQNETFDPVIGSVGVRGNDQTSGGVLNWGATNVILTREVNGVKGDPFWSGYAFIPKDSVDVGSDQAYKFFMVAGATGDQWEGRVNPNDPDGNRIFTYTANLVNVSGDTTLHWVYFNNTAPVQGVLVDATVTFRVSTEALEQLELFDSALGDQINVIGPNGFDVEVGLPDDFIHMNFNPLLNEWTVTEPFRKFPGEPIEFKYFVRWDASRVDPNSPNFIPNIFIRGINDTGIHENEDSGWEEPAVTGGGNRRYIYTSDPEQAVPGDFGFNRNFFNSIPGNGVIPDPITITWNINMVPATDPASNTNIPLFNPATDSVWIRPDGSLFALSQGFPTFNANMVLLEDEDGDMVYSGSMTTTGPAPYQIEFVVGYGTTTGTIITNGGGFEAGRRYYQFVQPTNIALDLTTTWPSEFNLPTLDWVEDNLPFETPPDLTTPTSVEDGEVLPFSFALDQNYPNPFNPQTTIRYHVAQDADVKVEVFNIMGQRVRTLVDQKMKQGTYTVVWNGDNNRGEIVSSGIYFVKMSTGFFKQIRKMTLVR